MRNLTIKRNKTFVASLGKMKVYIEDPASTDITINDTPCRKLGELKNGEEKTFQIDECSAKLFVIADKISKNFCNEYYTIPEGNEDIFLSGKNKFNLATGNAFRFDGNTAPEVQANRKKNFRKGLIFLIICAVIGFTVGYFVTSFLLQPKSKTFSSNGINITLTEDFQKVNVENFHAAYGSGDVSVFVVKEPFTLMPALENYTIEQYAELSINVNNIENGEVSDINGITFYEYETTNENNIKYNYAVFLYKSNDSFWIVQFATESDETEDYAKDIVKWASSVTFSE